MALSLNDLKKGKAGKSLSSSSTDLTRRMVRPWEDPTRTEEEHNAELVANQEQTSSKPVAEIGSKQEANGQQIGSMQKEQKEKPVAQPVARRVANQEQIGSKLVANLPITQIVGNERKLLFLIFDECRKEGSLTSPPLTREFISKSLETSHGTVKSAILRLERKGFLRRQACKVGRGGWLQFSLPRELFQKLILNETGSKLVAKEQQTSSKSVAKPVAQLVADSSSSSSSLDLDLNKLTNTATSDQSGDLPLEWNEIDSSPLSAIRFGRPQLAQLARVGNLTVDQLQESIYAFAFDLDVNGKGREINGHALNYFMGILRRGPYAPASNYEAPDVRQMRLYLEAKKREQQTRLELESQLEAVEFDSWVVSLSNEESARFVPPTDFAKPGSPGHNVQLKQYFRDNIWPGRRELVQQGAGEI